MNLAAIYAEEGRRNREAQGRGVANSNSLDAIAQARAQAFRECGIALAHLLPGNPQLATFAEALTDGVAPAAAVKLAARVAAADGRSAPLEPSADFAAGEAAAKELAAYFGEGPAHSSRASESAGARSSGSTAYDDGAAQAKELMRRAGQPAFERGAK